MRAIELNAATWRTVHDFYDAVLAAIGAPERHGRNMNALIDSMVWGGINAVVPPYTIRIRGVGVAPNEVREAIELLKRCLAEGRAEYQTSRGRDIEVQLETIL